MNGSKILAFREPFWSFCAEKLLDCGKVPWIKENLFDCGKLNFLKAEKIIGLMILKTNASVETIKTYLLSLEQKLSSLAFFCGR